MGLQQTSIRFQHTFYPHFYLCNYLPVSVGKDTLSHSLLKFKRGRQPDLNAWIDCSLEMLAPTLIPPDITIIRALHHEETILLEDSPPTSLDKLGSALALRLKGQYRPTLLRKFLPTREIKELSKDHREAELQGLYSLHSSLIDPSPSFLILDDILTTGTTMKTIIDAILQPYPKTNLLIFTLAKSDYDTRFNKSTPLQGQNYQLDPGSNWIVAEEEASFYAPDQLKTRIRTDTF